AHWQVLPVLLELEAGVGDLASSGGLPVAPDWGDGPMISDDADAHARRLLDVADDLVDLAIALWSFTKRNVVGVHADGFEHDPGLIARVFHSPQLIRIPSTIRGTLPHLHSQVADAVAQVVLQVRLRGDARSRNAVIVAANVHEGVPPRSARRLRGSIARRSGRDPRGHGAERSGELSTFDHACPQTGIS